MAALASTVMLCSAPRSATAWTTTASHASACVTNGTTTMNKQKELTFALLILAAPHLAQTLSIWIGGGIVVAAVILSDTVCNAARRMWWHLTRQ